MLGNCIYDKAYLQKVTKMKVQPTKFNEDTLHRHSDFAKKEPVVKSEPVATIPPVSGTGLSEPRIGSLCSQTDIIFTANEIAEDLFDGMLSFAGCTL